MSQQATGNELIQRYLKGDEEALRLLYEQHIPGVFRFIFRLAPSDIDVEDIVQEAFLKAWKHLARFDQSHSFKTWLFTIAKNTLFDAIKKKRPLTFSELNTGQEDQEPLEIDIADERPLPSELLEEKESQVRLEALLDQLSPPQKTVVTLHLFEDLTFREIGEVVGESMETVKTRYRRALAVLLRLLQKPPAS